MFAWVALQVVTPNVPDIQVVPPEDKHRRHVIDTLALYVLDDGCAFEQAIMERGRGNPLFSFLFDLGSPDHTYYIWRLFSFAQVLRNAFMRGPPCASLLHAGRFLPPCSPGCAFCAGPHLAAPLQLCSTLSTAAACCCGGG